VGGVGVGGGVGSCVLAAPITGAAAVVGLNVPCAPKGVDFELTQLENHLSGQGTL